VIGITGIGAPGTGSIEVSCDGYIVFEYDARVRTYSERYIGIQADGCITKLRLDPQSLEVVSCTCVSARDRHTGFQARPTDIRHGVPSIQDTDKRENYRVVTATQSIFVAESAVELLFGAAAAPSLGIVDRNVMYYVDAANSIVGIRIDGLSGPLIEEIDCVVDRNNGITRYSTGPSVTPSYGRNGA
jgi:hypothetical protein